MGLLRGAIDTGIYLLMKIKDLALWIIETAGRLATAGYRRYLEVGVFEKCVLYATVPAFFAIIMSVAKYYIFESYFYINNPLAVYMIGIVFVMVGSLFFTGRIKYMVRMALNLYYLFWVIYLPLAGELIKAQPHVITPGYYVNIAVPLIYMVLASLSYFITRE